MEFISFTVSYSWKCANFINNRLHCILSVVIGFRLDHDENYN